MLTFIALITTIVVLAIGILGSFLNLCVFSHEAMRKISTFHFLLYLTAIDILVLGFGSSNALLLYGFNFEIRDVSDWTCRLETFLTSFLRHLSSHTLVAVNIDRVLEMCKKNMNQFWGDGWIKRLVYTVRKSTNKIGLCMLVIIASVALFNCHFLIFLKLNDPSNHRSIINNTNPNNKSSENYQSQFSHLQQGLSNRTDIQKSLKVCFPLKKTQYYDFLVNKWVFLDMAFYSLVPFVIMSICSYVILVELRKQSAELVATNSRMNGRIMRKKRQYRKILIMLLSTNVFFLVCSVLFSLFNISNHPENETPALFNFRLLAYASNSFNFIFYGLFAEKYRRVLVGFFARILQIPNRPRNHLQSQPSNRTQESNFFFNQTESSHSNRSDPQYLDNNQHIRVHFHRHILENGEQDSLAFSRV
jgi:hypothetical protein